MKNADKYAKMLERPEYIKKQEEEKDKRICLHTHTECPYKLSLLLGNRSTKTIDQWTKWPETGQVECNYYASVKFILCFMFTDWIYKQFKVSNWKVEQEPEMSVLIISILIVLSVYVCAC